MATKKTSSTNTSSLDESTLTPRAKILLDELSQELKLPRKTVAELARMMYKLYKDKR